MPSQMDIDRIKEQYCDEGFSYTVDKDEKENVIDEDIWKDGECVEMREGDEAERRGCDALSVRRSQQSVPSVLRVPISPRRIRCTSTN